MQTCTCITSTPNRVHLYTQHMSTSMMVMLLYSMMVMLLQAQHATGMQTISDNDMCSEGQECSSWVDAKVVAVTCAQVR